MLEQYYSCARVVGAYREVPLGTYLDGYVRHLGDQGYARATVQHFVQVAVRFGRWLRGRGLGAGDLSDELVERFLRRRPPCRNRRRAEACGLRHMLGYVRGQGGTAGDGPRGGAGPLGHLLEEFGRYLLHERALSEATVATYCPRVRLFLAGRFGPGRLELDKICAEDVRRFALETARARAPAGAQLALSALRSFLRFLHLRGEVAAGLAEHVPAVASRRLAGLPKYLCPGEVERVLCCCDRRTAAGRRDFAILLLLARLGLRAGEVVSLELGDIRWGAAEISVCGKGRRRRRLPLPEDVGSAIASYLKDGRPARGPRRVFLCARAPHRGLKGSSSLCTIVSRALSRAGLDPPAKGAHVFRHSLATGMLRRGATLQEIGQVLGHASADTTSIYAKVDTAGLRELALPWPGEQP